MRNNKNLALSLRASGYSYNQIHSKLNIPKSTLSDWLKKIEWSNRIKINLINSAKTKSRIRMKKLNNVRGQELKKIYRYAHNEAGREFQQFKYYPLFISGISIYWGEGDKLTKHHVRISNTDPSMIKTFVKFLIKVCGVNQNNIKASVLIYPDHSPEKCVNYWARSSGLKINNFNKCTLINGRHKTKRLPNGVCNIVVGSSYLKVKMMRWLTLLPNELINNK